MAKKKESTSTAKVGKAKTVKKVKKPVRLKVCTKCTFKPGLIDDRTLCSTCEGSGKIPVASKAK